MLLVSIFSFDKGITTISQLLFESDQKDELVLKGVINPGFIADLNGKIFLTIPSKTSTFVQANLDKRGKLEIPFRWKGTLLKPSFSIGTDTVKTMTDKALHLEKVRLNQTVMGQIQNNVTEQKKVLESKVK